MSDLQVPEVTPTPVEIVTPAAKEDVAAVERQNGSNLILDELKRSGVLDIKEEIEPKTQSTAEIEPSKEGSPAPSVETTEGNQSPDDQLKQARFMIGRQSNEIGELRKQLLEFKQTLEKGSKVEPSKPVEQKGEVNYDDVIKASDFDLTNTLRQAYKTQNIYITEDDLAMKAKEVRLQARLAKVEQQTQKIEQQERYAREMKAAQEQEQRFIDAHPELDKRKETMGKLYKQVFPKSQSLDDLASIYGLEKFSIVHTLYEVAAMLPQISQQVTTVATDKRKTETLKSNTSLSNASTEVQQKKLSPVQLEVAKAWPELYPIKGLKQ